MNFTSTGMLNRWGTPSTAGVGVRNHRIINRRASHSHYANRLFATPTNSSNYIMFVADPSYPVLEGFDVVEAKQKNNGLMSTCLGEQLYKHTFNGYTFWFKNNNNKMLFADKPSSYIPACGGFCAWSVSEEIWKVPLSYTYNSQDNHKTYAVPSIVERGCFAIYNNILYCFLWRESQLNFESIWNKVFVANIAIFVPKANMDIRIDAMNMIWNENLIQLGVSSVFATSEIYP